MRLTKCLKLPFMVGPSPIRRTKDYLEAGKLHFKESVQVCTLNYNTSGKHHDGAREFTFWFMPQVQYKNPNVQIVTLKNMTPTPFFRFYFESGEEMLVDIFGKKKEEILDHLIKVVGKSEDVLKIEAQSRERKDNPANFGYECDRHCICEIIGQVPCPKVVEIPLHMRGKYTLNKE